MLVALLFAIVVPAAQAFAPPSCIASQLRPATMPESAKLFPSCRMIKGIELSDLLYDSVDIAFNGWEVSPGNARDNVRHLSLDVISHFFNSYNNSGLRTWVLPLLLLRGLCW